MVGRFLRVIGTVLAIAVAFVMPVLATATATSAAADTVVDGCTIVSNPTSTNFTNCPGAHLAGADLSSFDLSFANFAGADFAGAILATCPYGVDSHCGHADLSDANLSQVNLSGAVLAAATASELRPGAQAATFDGANLADANLTDAVLAASVSLDGEPFGSLADFTDATLTNANFTGTILVPPNQSVTATSQAGAVATWSTCRRPSPDATPGACTPAVGVNLRTLLEHCHLPGPRRQRRCRHRDLPGQRGSDNPVLHPGSPARRRRDVGRCVLP